MVQHLTKLQKDSSLQDSSPLRALNQKRINLTQIFLFYALLLLFNRKRPQRSSTVAFQESKKEKMYSLKTNIVLVRHGESFNNTLYDVIRAKFGQDISDAQIDEEEARLRDPDCTLSTRGFEQAELLGDYLLSLKKKCEVDSRLKKNNGLFYDFNNVELYSSPMKRCLLTIKPMSEKLNRPVTVIPFLYETSGCYITTSDGEKVGLTGNNKHQIEAAYANYTCAPGMECGWYQGSTKETFEEFKVRSSKIVDWIWELHRRPSQDLASCIQSTTTSIPATTPRDIIIVCHGNVLSTVMSSLLNGNALIVHSNSAFSHIQLYNTNIPKGGVKSSSSSSSSSNSSSSSSSSSSSNNNSSDSNSSNSNSDVGGCSGVRSDGVSADDVCLLSSSSSLLSSAPTVVASVLKCMNNSSHLYGRDELLTGNEVLDDWWIQDYVEYMPNDS